MTDAAIDAPPVAEERIAAEMVRITYRTARRSSLSSWPLVLFVLLVGIPAITLSVLVWIGVYALWNLAEEVLLWCYRRAAPADHELGSWAWGEVIVLATCGLLWGIAFVALVDPARPLTIGLLICAGAGLTAGSIGFRSTILPGFYAYNLLIALPLAFRLLWGPDATFRLLGVAILGFVIAVIGYGRAQHALIRDTLRIRFQNEALVGALRAETSAAEAARREAEAASLVKSQFLAAASHDLRQPLYALGLFSASLEGVALDEEGRRLVGRISESVGVLEALFAGLLDLSRLQAGGVTPVFAPVSVDDAFDRLRQVFGPIAAERSISLRLRQDGEWVLADVVLLDQILANLVSNALRYTDRGAVLVAARRRRDTVSLEVWDTGIGIAAADRARIFEEFVQLGNAERDRRHGLGLGLSIVRRAADLLDAGLTIASVPGRGSRFAIRLPAAARSGGAAPPPLPAVAGGAVLVIDDEPDVREGLVRLLSGWGIAVYGCGTGAAALALIAAGRRFATIMCDYRLPNGETGLEVLDAIVRAHPAPAPRVALVTGDVDTVVIAAAKAQGVELLHKPVAATRLRMIVGADAGP